MRRCQLRSDKEPPLFTLTLICLLRVCVMCIHIHATVHVCVCRGCFFTLGIPLKVVSTNKLIWARLGVTRMTYVNVDSPNLGSSYLNFLGEAQ